ncbi:MAG: radical SAM protein [Thiogranum sp.]|jgi:wyosine [tRNA(Phe)-imidazoG37] synthetase (radical SAM superfamily)
MTIAFGPVPSRRLGRSLGINNIPPKSCSYSCLYCQVGATQGKMVEPRNFYAPEDIYQEVSEQLQKAHRSGEPVDYLTFVPDGEPTLDINLGRAIDLLRPYNIPIAVISNASLLWHKAVRAAIGKADWVSVKIDSVVEQIWKQVNRPHEALRLDDIMDGIRQFARHFHGELVAETMLIHGINDTQDSVASVAGFLHEIGVSRAYLSIPTRPTAETGICGPSELTVNRAYQILASCLPHVEYLIGYEGDAFAFTGDARHDLLSITAVHPMRESAVREFLKRARTEWSVVESLIAEGKLEEVDYLGNRYFVRRLST